MQMETDVFTRAKDFFEHFLADLTLGLDIMKFCNDWGTVIS